MNPIKMVIHREIEGTLKNVTISKTPSGKYYASIVTETEIDKAPLNGDRIGLDLGLKDFVITSKPERLRNWHQRNGSEAEKLRSLAAERGKVIHKLIEARFKGEDVECPTDVSDFWNEARKILGAIGEVVASEKPVYHPQLQYAGTLDLLAYWQGVLTLFDFKTSHREKRAQWLTDAKLQIAAYRAAYECLFGVSIPQGLIMVITPNTVQLFSL